MAELREITVPDIGDFDEVDVVEVLVTPGTHVEAEQSLITIESEKASMEVPAPLAGTVRELRVAVGDKVKEGSVIATIEVGDGSTPTTSDDDPAAPKPPPSKPPSKPAAKPAAAAPAPQTVPTTPAKAEQAIAESSTGNDREPPPPPSPPSEQQSAKHTPPPSGGEGGEAAARQLPHASPSVRRFARELGIDLGQLEGSGPKGRIVKQDLQNYVKATIAAVQQQHGSGIPEVPEIDFTRFGEIERQPLSRLNRLTARNMTRSWLNVPQVTQYDEADITDLEDFRRQHQSEGERQGFKLTFVSFVLKACAATLRVFPRFNASLAAGGEELIVKKYFHLGVAVDTPEGLVVPVIRDVDRKGLLELARELAEVSERARAGKLTPADVQGASFTVSSLGGIGGTAFSPIVNAPEVAILGVARAQQRPVIVDGQIKPRLMLPLCLSYDHRVIDGAGAARFVVHLKQLLADFRLVVF